MPSTEEGEKEEKDVTEKSKVDIGIMTDNALESEMDVVEKLRNDNLAYRRNFDQLRNHYFEQHHSYKNQILKWQGQLEQKSQEFERLKCQFEKETVEINNLKTRLGEEMETRVILERELEENEEYRQMYHYMKREYDILQKELEKFKETSQKEKKEQHEELAILKIENQDVQQKLERLTSKHEKLQGIKNEIELRNAQLESDYKTVLQELEDVTMKKTDILKSKEEVYMSSSKLQAELLIQCRTAESDLERYKKKCKSLYEEIENCNSTIARMNAQIIKLGTENIQLKIALDEARFEPDKGPDIIPTSYYPNNYT